MTATAAGASGLRAYRRCNPAIRRVEVDAGQAVPAARVEAAFNERTRAPSWHLDVTCRAAGHRADPVTEHRSQQSRQRAARNTDGVRIIAESGGDCAHTIQEPRTVWSDARACGEIVEVNQCSLGSSRGRRKSVVLRHRGGASGCGGNGGKCRAASTRRSCGSVGPRCSSPCSPTRPRNGWCHLRLRLRRGGVSVVPTLLVPAAGVVGYAHLICKATSSSSRFTYPRGRLGWAWMETARRRGHGGRCHARRLLCARPATAWRCTSSSSSASCSTTSPRGDEKFMRASFKHIPDTCRRTRPGSASNEVQEKDANLDRRAAERLRAGSAAQRGR